MKRKEFLKQLISFAPILVTPSLHAISSVSKNYVYLLHDFIRGFQYYKGEALFENLREDDALELVREYMTINMIDMLLLSIGMDINWVLWHERKIIFLQN